MRFTDLKHVSQTDEHEVVESAARVLINQTLNPGFHAHPNHISIYADALLFKVIAAVKYHQPFQEAFAANKAYFYYVSRLLMATMGTLMIVVAFFIGRTFGLSTGLLSALLVAMLPVYIDSARCSRPDTPLTLFTMLTTYFSILYVQTKGKLWPLIAATASAAFSVSAKAPGIVNFFQVLVLIPLVQWRNWRKLLLHFACAACFFAAALFVALPSLFLYPETRQTLMKVKSQQGLNGFEGLGFVGNINFYLSEYYRQTGMFLAAFFLTGLATCYKRFLLFIPLFTGVWFLFLLSAHSMYRPVWGMPIYITPLFISAIAIADILALAWDRRILRTFVTLLAFFALFHVVALGSKTSLAYLVSKSTTSAMAEYLQEKQITPEETLYEGYTAFLPWGYQAKFWVNLNKLPPGIKYVQLSSASYERFMSRPGYFRGEVKWYNTIFLFPKEVVFEAGCSKHISTGFAFIDKSVFNNVLSLLFFRDTCMKGPTQQLYRVPQERQSI